LKSGTQLKGVAIAGCVLVCLLSGCYSQSPGTDEAGSIASSLESAGPFNQTPQNPSVAADLAECTEASISSALPDGVKVERFNCAIVPPTMWAAAIDANSQRAYFLESTVGGWHMSNVDKACGSPGEDIPDEIRDYCPSS